MFIPPVWLHFQTAADNVSWAFEFLDYHSAFSATRHHYWTLETP